MCARCHDASEEPGYTKCTSDNVLPPVFVAALSTHGHIQVWYAINRDPITGKPAGPGFSGKLPASISNARNLQFVELSGHQLTGAVPALPGQLRMFEVHNNALDGDIACE